MKLHEKVVKRVKDFKYLHVGLTLWADGESNKQTVKRDQVGWERMKKGKRKSQAKDMQSYGDTSIDVWNR